MKHNLIPLWTIIHKETARIIRIWTQTLIPPILTSVLFILIFGYSLGSKMSSVAGVSYIEFIIPGLVMMGVIMSAYASTSFSLYIQKFQGSIQELLVSPISYWQIIWGITCGALVRAILVGLGILFIGLLLTSITVHNIFIILFFIVMTSLLFAFAGIITALWANNFDQMNIFSTFLITPLTYLGGIFYSIHLLPPFWQAAVRFNPILYMIDGFRYGFLGIHDVSLIASFLVVTLLTFFFFLVSVYLFKKGYKLRT